VKLKLGHTISFQITGRDQIRHGSKWIPCLLILIHAGNLDLSKIAKKLLRCKINVVFWENLGGGFQ
jgi:hypothetical protein